MHTAIITCLKIQICFDITRIYIVKSPESNAPITRIVIGRNNIIRAGYDQLSRTDFGCRIKIPRVITESTANEILAVLTIKGNEDTVAIRPGHIQAYGRRAH